MGVCVNIFGIPVIEDSDCRARRERANNERKAIEEASDVAKKEAVQGGRTDRNYNRNARKLGKTVARQYGTAPGFGAGVVDIVESTNESLAEVFGGSGGEIVGAYATGGASLLTGLFGGTDAAGNTVPMSPVVPLAAAAALAVVIYNNR